MIDSPLTEANEYDGLLAAIPTLLLGGTILGRLTAIPAIVGVSVGALLATVVLLISLFVVPPT